MTDTAPIELALHNYRGFIQRFRAALGVGAVTPAPRASSAAHASSPPAPATVDVSTGLSIYRYRRSDLYLTHGKAAGGGPFQPLKENYADMSPPAKLSFASILSALHEAPNNDRARPTIIAITSEAARSQVVYQVVQRLLYSKEKAVDWDSLCPLFSVWMTHAVSQPDRGESGYHHKSKPPAFGPLGVRDYYQNEKANAAMQELDRAGFQLNP